MSMDPRYQEFLDAQKVADAMKKVFARPAVGALLKGAPDGHEFYSNQYTGGGSLKDAQTHHEKAAAALKDSHPIAADAHLAAANAFNEAKQSPTGSKQQASHTLQGAKLAEKASNTERGPAVGLSHAAAVVATKDAYAATKNATASGTRSMHARASDAHNAAAFANTRAATAATLAGDHSRALARTADAKGHEQQARFHTSNSLG